MLDKLFTEFHFLRPWWLLALLPLLWLVFLLTKRRLGSSRWEAVCDAALLPYILSGRSGNAHYYTIVIVVACGMLTIFALAGPVWERLPQPVFRDDSALVIALDLSRSMDADDIKPSRLERARFKIVDLLRLRGSGQTALVVYAASAFTVVPLTDDVKTIGMHLPVLTTSLMPAQGSDVNAALIRSAALLKQAGRRSGHILLVTDSVNSDYDTGQFGTAREQGYFVSILAVGTHQGSPVKLSDGSFLKDKNGTIVLPTTDHALLKKKAAAGGGLYMPVQVDDQDINALQLFFDRRLARQGEERAKLNTTLWREQGPWLLLLILPFAALSFRRGYIALLILFFLPVLQPVHAVGWKALWLNENQRAMRQFNAGNVEAAAEHFTDPSWKAAAKYRVGDYAGAVALLAGMKSVDSLYNTANALAKQGQYKEALALYDRVLEIDPGNEDAQYNRGVVADALRQQQTMSQENESSNASDAGQQDATDTGQQSQLVSDQAQSALTQPDPTVQTDTISEAAPNQSGSSVEQQPSQDVQQPKAAAAQQQQSATDVESVEQRPADELVQATEQWLRRVPDDPAGLLRRKFYFQYQDQAVRQGDTKGW